jgi:hypothetical protein
MSITATERDMNNTYIDAFAFTFTCNKYEKYEYFMSKWKPHFEIYL